MSAALRRTAGALAASLVALALLPGSALGSPRSGPAGGTPSLAYPGDPKTESALVGDEDRRLIEVRTVTALAPASTLRNPYRLETGSGYTLVLTARQQAYTIHDLLRLAPSTFVRRPGGSYLLSENLVIGVGATLLLKASGGLDLRLASGSRGFVSIVSEGGRLVVSGTHGAPVRISSFDPTTGSPDHSTDDGRAYVRAIGGQVAISYAKLANLGFWSGRTGGLSLTGTDRPDSGSLAKIGQSLARLAKQPGSNVAGPTPVLDIGANGGYSFVTAEIDHTSVDGNAFGLFMSGANGIDLRSSSFTHNLVDGVVMHRYVANAVVQATSADNNGRDGIVLARATTGIVLTQVEADGNQRNGVTMSGLPLANGPSAMGTSVDSYGNNSLSNSRTSGNGRYGVDVIGGTNVRVQGNEVRNNAMGIVVRDVARKVSVVGNDVAASTSQGIALRDGPSDAVVSGNQVTNGTVGLYLRNTSAEVTRNVLTDSSDHGMTLVGDLTDTTTSGNTISGRGASAIDAKRAANLGQDALANNRTDGWNDTTPFLVTLKRLLQPLTLVWLVLAVLLVLSAVSGARHQRVKRHPYLHQAPVTDGIAVEPSPEGAGA